jgi:hypothetical protein
MNETTLDPAAQADLYHRATSNGLAVQEKYSDQAT